MTGGQRVRPPLGLNVNYGSWNAATNAWTHPALASFRCLCGYASGAAGTKVPAFVANEARAHAGVCPGRGRAADVLTSGAATRSR